MIIAGDCGIPFRGLVEVAPRPLGGRSAFLDGPHLAARHFRSEGEADRTAAGAQIDHFGAVHAVSGGPVDAFLHDQFGFRTWNEHAWTDFQIKVAKRRVAGDVLQRLAFDTTGQHGLETFHRRFRVFFFGQTFDAIAHEHGFVHVLQVRMERFGEQQFGVVLRSVDARRA